ncbi:hypothetical protein ACM66B_004130 [Microbotryomycetes sp. NB124-2]
MAKKVFLLRHGQALHNVEPEDHSIPDPILTQKGQLQALSVASRYACFFASLDPSQTTIITSPLRRTIQTTLAAFASLLPPVAAHPVRLAIMPECVETGSGVKPCDTGSDLEETKLLFPQEFLDWSRCRPGWNENKGFYDSSEQGLRNRAKWFRRYLRDECETEIVVVVCHFGFLRRITKTPPAGAVWPNSELREYRFRDESGDDPEADLEELVHPIL